MKKRLLLATTILCGLWHNLPAQSRAGVEQYYYMGNYQTFAFVPVVYYQSAKKWYAEGRFNYEALNTMALYGGKTFDKTGVISYTASPLLGIVLGEMNGGSVGLNLEADYHRLSFNTQSQYTFSAQQRTNNFVYSWSDLTYRVSGRFAAGASLQQTKLYHVNGAFDTGILLKPAYKSWAFPLYLFRPESKERYFVLGINYEWENNHAKNSIDH
ncbi:hypothetical protein [Mucilaginibacter sp.]|uniref:hypothetical protein n=1 Tax=Mucilaginibacter sp. TaxID=1882438 RepID=UPI003AFF9C9E